MNNLEREKVNRHIHSRHIGYKDKIMHKCGNEFGQGTLFPNHIKASHITQMKRFVEREWLKQIKYNCSAIKEIQERSNGWKITVKYNKFGIKYIGSFVDKSNILHSIYPEESNKGAPLRSKGKKLIKSYRSKLK
jgi:hypothetical protein